MDMMQIGKWCKSDKYMKFAVSVWDSVLTLLVKNLSSGFMNHLLH